MLAARAVLRSILMLTERDQKHTVSFGKRSPSYWQPYLSQTALTLWISGRPISNKMATFLLFWCDKMVKNMYAAYRLWFLQDAFPFTIYQGEAAKLIQWAPAKELMPNPFSGVCNAAYMAKFFTDRCCLPQCTPFFIFQSLLWSSLFLHNFRVQSESWVILILLTWARMTSRVLPFVSLFSLGCICTTC